METVNHKSKSALLSSKNTNYQTQTAFFRIQLFNITWQNFSTFFWELVSTGQGFIFTNTSKCFSFFLLISFWLTLILRTISGAWGTCKSHKTASRYNTRDGAPSSIIWPSAFSPTRETYYRLPRMCGNTKKPFYYSTMSAQRVIKDSHTYNKTGSATTISQNDFQVFLHIFMQMFSAVQGSTMKFILRSNMSSKLKIMRETAQILWMWDLWK